MANRSIEFDIVGNDKASGNLRGVQGAIADLGKKIAGFFTASALFDRALGLAQQGFSAFITTLQDTAALNDQAKAAGLTTAEFQRLGIAAHEAGLDQQGLMKGLKTIKEFLRDARIEGSKQSEVLRALGYSQEEITSGNIDAMSAMMRISGAVEAATTSQEKYNVAASVFGAKAQELIPLLDGLRNALAAAAAEDIIGDKTIQNLDDAEKRVDRLIRRLKVLTAEAAGTLRLPNVIPGTDLVNVGIAAGLAITEPDKRKQIPVSEKDKAAAEALGKLGMKSVGSAMGNVSTAQSLGMATSIALAQQQTAYLATIAANTAPQPGSAIPGRTDFTKPADATAAELSATYQNIRYTTSPTSKMRPAR